MMEIAGTSRGGHKYGWLEAMRAGGLTSKPFSSWMQGVRPPCTQPNATLGCLAALCRNNATAAGLPSSSSIFTYVFKQARHGQRHRIWIGVLCELHCEGCAGRGNGVHLPVVLHLRAGRAVSAHQAQLKLSQQHHGWRGGASCDLQGEPAQGAGRARQVWLRRQRHRQLQSLPRSSSAPRTDVAPLLAAALVRSPYLCCRRVARPARLPGTCSGGLGTRVCERRRSRQLGALADDRANMP